MTGFKRVPRQTAFVLAAFLLFAGCKEVLYSDLSEVDANEMVAVLSLGGINASRQADKDNRYTIFVEGAQVPAATIELRNAGLPRQSFQSMGDVFSASGIIGTPFEQHARYIHALNQEIGRMLNSIDGVEDATVIVNAPPPPSSRREIPEATAAITIHHEVGFVAAENLSKIKQLVSHSVPDLPYENVAVVFFERASLTIAPPIEGETQPEMFVAGLFQPSNQSNMSIAQVATLLSFVLICVVAFIILRAPNRPSAVKRKSDTRPIGDVTGRRPS